VGRRRGVGEWERKERGVSSEVGPRPAFFTLYSHELHEFPTIVIPQNILNINQPLRNATRQRQSRKFKLDLIKI